MIIHDREKDYYDSASGFGVDTTIHYNRGEKGLKLWKDEGCDIWCYKYAQNKFSQTTEKWLTHTSQIAENLYLLRRLVGFCGHIYPVIFVTNSYCNFDAYKDALAFYGKDSLFDYLVKNTTKPHLFRFYEWRKQNFNDEAKRNIFEKRKFTHFKELLSKSEQQQDGLFLESQCPIWFATEEHNQIEIHRNPKLKDLQFYKVKDAFSAFQEISMYLTNQLVREKEVDEIEDKYKIGQHGFDKLSFRHPIK